MGKAHKAKSGTSPVPAMPLTVVTDKRFRAGNIKQTGSELRGHPDTMKMEPLRNTLGLPFDLCPPIVVSRELAASIKAIKESI